MKVFISHSFTDAELARRVGEGLRGAGFEVWDNTEILPGENWAARVAEALQESDAMVVLLTPESVRAQNVSYELGYALGKEDFKGRVVPVVAAAPGELPREQIPWVLNRFGVIQLSGRDRDEVGIRRIAQVLNEAA